MDFLIQWGLTLILVLIFSRTIDYFFRRKSWDWSKLAAEVFITLPVAAVIVWIVNLGLLMKRR